MSELQAPLELALGGYSESNFATAGNIRDRIYTLAEATTPTSPLGVGFRRYRNEGGADFRTWAEENVTGAFRRFQVRQIDDETGPDVSNVYEERVRVRFEIVVAYPQNQRYGREAAMDRDDVIAEDWLKLNYAAVGIYARASFSDANDCTPLGAIKTRETGNGVDFLVCTAEFEYVRSTTA